MPSAPKPLYLARQNHAGTLLLQWDALDHGMPQYHRQFNLSCISTLTHKQSKAWDPWWQWNLNHAQTPTKALGNFMLILARLKFHFIEVFNFIFLPVPATSPRLQVLRQVGQAVLGNTDMRSPSNFYMANFYILAASLQVFCDQGKENTEVFWIGEQVLINTFESWSTAQWMFLSNKAAWQTTLSYLTLPKSACYPPTCHHYSSQTLGQWF